MSPEKAKRLVAAYIELGQQSCRDDSEIIDVLEGIFTREELEELGCGNFVRDYFDDGEG